MIHAIETQTLLACVFALNVLELGNYCCATFSLSLLSEKKFVVLLSVPVCYMLTFVLGQLGHCATPHLHALQ